MRRPQLPGDRHRLRLDGVPGQEHLPGDLRERQVGGEHRQQTQLGGGQGRGARGGRTPGAGKAPARRSAACRTKTPRRGRRTRISSAPGAGSAPPRNRTTQNVGGVVLMHKSTTRRLRSRPTSASDTRPRPRARCRPLGPPRIQEPGLAFLGAKAGAATRPGALRRGRPSPWMASSPARTPPRFRVGVGHQGGGVLAGLL